MSAPALLQAPAVGQADKRLATAQARAALRGITLTPLQGDDGRPEYIASLHAMTRAFRDLAEVESWLDRIEGRAR